METTVKSLSIIDFLTSKLEVIQNFVVDYLEKVNYTLPTWKSNDLSGFYIPCSNLFHISEEYLNQISELESKQLFDEFGKISFYSYMLANKFRVNLKLTNKGKIGISLLEVQTAKLGITSKDINNEVFEVIELS